MRLISLYVEFVLIFNILGANRLYLQACLQVNAMRPQDTKEARTMALLLNHEVVGITCSAKIQVMPALSHGHQLTCSSTRSLKFPTFHDSLNK